MKILILEDDTIISELIKTYFELNNHSVDIYTNGEDLLNNACLDIYDIFLFDINTPKINGIDTLKQIRLDKIYTPTIFLTALIDIEDIKLGYNAGCNDYLKKPFNLEELDLRINQLINKHINRHIKITNNYTFELESMTLLYDDNIVNLNIKEKNLLYVLLKNMPNTVSSEYIISYVWENKDVCSNTLRTTIKKLRLKLKDDFIKNIRNMGYKIEKYD